MAMVNLTADTLGDIHEGRARLMIRDALVAIFNDIEARGRDGKPRELNMKLTMTPQDNEVVFDLQVSPKLPAMRTGENRGRIRMGAGQQVNLLFRDDSDDVNQPVIDDDNKNK